MDYSRDSHPTDNLENASKKNNTLPKKIRKKFGDMVYCVISL